jgi:hypothetical protein
MSKADLPAPKPSGGLRERAITAAILAPIGIAGVMLMPQIWFAIALGLLFLVGVWEWTRLSGWRSTPVRIVLVALHVLMFTSVWFGSDVARTQTVWTGVVFWLLAPWWLRHYHFGEQAGKRSLLIKNLACALAIVPAWTAAIVLHGGDRGPWWVLFLLVLAGVRTAVPTSPVAASAPPSWRRTSVPARPRPVSTAPWSAARSTRSGSVISPSRCQCSDCRSSSHSASSRWCSRSSATCLKA